MKTLLILEDSSRVGFGGGQKMTLTVCQVLKSLFDFRFVDFSDVTRYAEVVQQQYPDFPFINIGSSDRYKGREDSWMWAIQSFILHGKKDIKKIVEGLDLAMCVAYATNKRSLLYAYLLNKLYGVPYVYHAHRVENENRIYQSVLRVILKRVSKIICVSQTVMDSIHKADNKVLLYNPSLNENGQKIIVKKKRPFVVAYIGSLIHIKGVESFIDAARMCDDRFEFRVYGDGPLKVELETRANGSVRFMGFIKDIIQEEYNSIDLVVVPTIVKEALSLVAVDAKSVGIPLVVTSPGGQAEIVEDGIEGYHIPMNDAEAIAEKVEQLEGNRVLYKKMSDASYKSSVKFNYSTFSEKLIEVFRLFC